MKKFALSLMLSISCASAMDKAIDGTTNEETKLGSRIVVVDRKVSLSGSMNLGILMCTDPYAPGVTVYNVSQAEGTPSVTGKANINWGSHTQPQLTIETSKDGDILVVKTDVPTEDNENN